MEKNSLKVSESDDAVAYVYLPDHPKKLIPGLSKKQISLDSLIDGYKGPCIYFDFNSDNVLIGIEIIG
nr:DUF2283 domain-containing protein [uncultured Fluviicola sp.]